MDHLRYPHWIHGPRGTAPSGTTFQDSNGEPRFPAFVLRSKAVSPNPLQCESPPPVFPRRKKKLEEKALGSRKEVPCELNVKLEVTEQSSIGKLKTLLPENHLSVNSSKNSLAPSPLQALDHSRERSMELSIDDTPVTSRSFSQSRSTLHSPGMVTLHSLGTMSRASLLSPLRNNKKSAILKTSTSSKSPNLEPNPRKTHSGPATVQRASSATILKNQGCDRNVFNANAIELLQKSTTSMQLGNKAGTFLFTSPGASADDQSRTMDKIHGIAYDEDNQFQMERGYSMDVVDLKEGMGDLKEDVEWKYGIEPKYYRDGFQVTRGNIAPSEPNFNNLPDTENTYDTSVTSIDEIEQTENKEDSAEEEEEVMEGEDEADIDLKHSLDEDNLETAMSIIYSKTESDPDHMTVCYSAPLTPIVE